MDEDEISVRVLKDMMNVNDRDNMVGWEEIKE
jgi:hypothetical protein